MTFGVGLTKTVAVVVGPTQPLAVGVIVNVTVTGANVTLTNIPFIWLPVPKGGIPVTALLLSLVHAYTVPGTLFGLEFVIVLINKREQTV